MKWIAGHDILLFDQIFFDVGVLRIEKLGLNTKAGKIKVAGAIVCVGGALTISLYKGRTFHILHHSLKHHSIAKQTKHYWARGSFFLVGSCLSYAIWFLVQVLNLIIQLQEHYSLPHDICVTSE